jgi:hypothetical protein
LAALSCRYERMSQPGHAFAKQRDQWEEQLDRDLGLPVPEDGDGRIEREGEVFGQRSTPGVRFSLAEDYERPGGNEGGRRVIVRRRRPQLQPAAPVGPPPGLGAVGGNDPHVHLPEQPEHRPLRVAGPLACLATVALLASSRAS